MCREKENNMEMWEKNQMQSFERNLKKENTEFLRD